jgi:hypothetical protein
MDKKKLEITSHNNNLLKEVSIFLKESKRINDNKLNEISLERTNKIIALLNEEIAFFSRVLDKNMEHTKQSDKEK